MKTAIITDEVPYLLGDARKANSQLHWKPTTTFRNLTKLMYEADVEYITDNKLTIGDRK